MIVQDRRLNDDIPTGNSNSDNCREEQHNPDNNGYHTDNHFILKNRISTQKDPERQKASQKCEQSEKPNW
jgi:hypothetical protein